MVRRLMCGGHECVAHDVNFERRPVTQTRLTPRISTLLLRIESEYREMPGLKLTEAQARRLWDLDGDTCNLVLTTLMEQRFLKCTANGTYVRATD